jgi:hypothetical protein
MDEVDCLLPESQVYHQSNLVVFILELLNKGDSEMWAVVGDAELCKE